MINCKGNLNKNFCISEGNFALKKENSELKEEISSWQS